MLHYSVRRGHYATTKNILYYNADVNAEDMYGYRPLDYALEIRNFELV